MSEVQTMVQDGIASTATVDSIDSLLNPEPSKKALVKPGYIEKAGERTRTIISSIARAALEKDVGQIITCISNHFDLRKGFDCPRAELVCLFKTYPFEELKSLLETLLSYEDKVGHRSSISWKFVFSTVFSLFMISWFLSNTGFWGFMLCTLGGVMVSSILSAITYNIFCSPHSVCKESFGDYYKRLKEVFGEETDKEIYNAVQKYNPNL